MPISDLYRIDRRLEGERWTLTYWTDFPEHTRLGVWVPREVVEEALNLAVNRSPHSEFRIVTREEVTKKRDDLIAELVGMVNDRDRQKAKQLVADHLAISIEIDKPVLSGTLPLGQVHAPGPEFQVRAAIQEALQVGRIVKDRHGKIWLAEWLPTHNGETFEPPQGN